MKNFESVYGLSLKLISMVIVVLAPVHSVLASVLILILADMFTGLWAAKREGVRITSSGLKKTIVKILAYEAVVIVAFVLENYLLQGVPVVKVIAGVIGMTEGKSFFENIKRITGIDFWAETLKRLQAAMSVAPDDKK